MNNDDIERAARNLHGEIWRRHAELWPGRKQLSVVEIVDPTIAAKVLGIDFQLHPELRWFTRPHTPLEETAGILDRGGPTILVSTKFPFETRRFTAAHELGHFLLHDDLVLHRDRPIAGLTIETNGRPLEERQADRFAASYLMPRKSVVEAFENIFLKAPYVFDDAAAFEFCPHDPDSLLRPHTDSMVRFFALAAARHYQGKHYVPLHKQFQVSVTSMAIRIKELSLVRD